jgi:guanine deaminase
MNVNRSSDPSLTGIRGCLIDCLEDPFLGSDVGSDNRAVRWFLDGLLVIAAGKIVACGNYDRLIADYPDLPITHYPDRIITPGLIDTHVHFPQTSIVASYGTQLLEWLEKYTFPEERKFQDFEYASRVAEIFLDELLRNGTTTAMVWTTVFPESTDALFQAAQRRNLRLIAGKIMMDRNAPDYLLDTPETAYRDSRSLIEQWHGCDRLSYALTPRFAPTSTPEQLQITQQLQSEFPSVYLQTHLSENLGELAWVKELFPDDEDYLAVYERCGLVHDRAVFAHGIHLSESEFTRLSAAGATLAFCPTSNLFLGSGLFKLHEAKAVERPIAVGLATDIGGGTSFSLLQTASEAYKVSQLQNQTLSAVQMLFLLTLGGARSLSLDQSIGNFEPGKEADFVVWNVRSTPIMDFRNREPIQTWNDLNDRLFSLLMMGDDRAVDCVYILGDRVLVPQMAAPHH